MKINDNIYNFSFQFIDYEFDTFTNESDIYDLNWLKCRYEFIFKGKHLSIDDASMTTFDVLNFILDIEYLLVNNEYKKIELQNLEPDFLMALISSNRGYTLNIHYNFYLNELFESLDFSVEMTKEEVANFVEELKMEISKFPYRRVVNYFGKNSKYENMNGLAIILKNDKLIKGTITNNSTDIIINKSEFFKIKITDIYCKINNKYLYSISLNNKPYSYALEDNLINEVHKLYDDNKLIIEYIYEIGFFKRRWFDSIDKNEIKLNKAGKKILRIFNHIELIYYNKKNITLQKDLIEKNKLADIDNRMVKLYFSKDYTRRIQIYKTNNIFSYIFEELEFREEIEYGTTYNYAYWSKIDDGQSHSYSSMEDLEEDIVYIIERNRMFKN